MNRHATAVPLPASAPRDRRHTAINHRVSHCFERRQGGAGVIAERHSKVIRCRVAVQNSHRMNTLQGTMALIGLGAVLVGLAAYSWPTGRDNGESHSSFVDGLGLVASRSFKQVSSGFEVTALSTERVAEQAGKLSPGREIVKSPGERLDELKRRFLETWHDHLSAEDWQVALELMAAAEACGDIDAYYSVTRILSMHIDSSNPSNGLIASLSWIRAQELQGMTPTEDAFSDCERFIRAGAKCIPDSYNVLSHVRERRYIYESSNSSRMSQDKVRESDIGYLIVMGTRAVHLYNEDVLALTVGKLQSVKSDESIPKLERVAAITFLLRFCSESSTPAKLRRSCCRI